ncbi:hypothetical protein [Pseudaminobacter soli (ex Li et al. 2025)]|uniref:DUF4403 domain-containing protein n=1 Tax=Pseudaminobacter soli (ex Li et al. 2025) TaxID=1295366 RepID=A0A2P7S4J5_9HYPH|nr:hypothetical protein [Mesorhizobium soli]PSJ57349.1 hypothetical protein C7I85_22415 [Mesorhizobium soli]
MRRLLWLVLFLALSALQALAQDAGDSRQVQIYLAVEIADKPAGAVAVPGEKVATVRGKAVRISGITSRDLAGKSLLVTVTPPQEFEPDGPEPESKCGDDDAPAKATTMFTREKPSVLSAEVGRDGNFEVLFTPKVTGTHEVEAADAENAYSGTAEFDVTELEAEEQCEAIPQDEIEEEAAGLTEVICEATDALLERVGDLPPSPAKDELAQRLKELADDGKEAVPCGEAPQWAVGYRHLEKLRKEVPAIRPAIAPATRQIKEWLRGARQARAEGRRAIAQITQGNVVCDQLDVIINGLKFVDFYLGLIIEPENFLGDWAKENIPTKLVGMIPAVKQNTVLKESIELGWKGVTTYEPKLEGGRIKISPQGFERLLAHQKMATAISTFLANRVFEALCQTFQGPIEGTMSAEFSAPSGIWWQYSIGITGQLILRYPKDAKGDVIALTGEFVGNAKSIKSWDNAVPVLFPGLAQGTVFRTLRIEPFVLDDFPAIYEKNLGVSKNQVAPDFNPVKSIIDQGGLITQYVMTPAFFRVPVRAELREKTLRLELQPAAVDFDDLRVKVVHIMLPVLSLWPEVIDYALPYKGAHFIMTRAMNDGPVTFDVERAGLTMKISKAFTRKKNTQGTTGAYTLTVDACNPGC